MWLHNLLFLGTVVCCFSAPTRSPAPVTQSWNHVAAIVEILTFLNVTPVTVNEEVNIVSEEFSTQRPTCMQTRLKVFEQSLRGNFTKISGNLKMIASHYQKTCPPTPETVCGTQIITFKDFIEDLRGFMLDIPLGCWEPLQK